MTHLRLNVKQPRFLYLCFFLFLHTTRNVSFVFFSVCIVRCFLKMPWSRPASWRLVHVSLLLQVQVVLLESHMYQHSEVHNGFLPALLPTTFSLQGNQCTEIQLRVTRMREQRIWVSSARCWQPGFPNIAVTVVICVGTWKARLLCRRNASEDARDVIML